jgi:CHAT domain-containing protein
MAVVSGDYRRAGWARLPEARKEAKELASEFKATPVDAAEGPVDALLKGKPRAQVLHFAIHGKFSPESFEQGMILVDGQIEADTVRGTVLHGTPFVFLNACQLGAADQVLGDYAGMAHSFLLSGASAVVAPLWNVRDTLAREISLEFYRTVYGSAMQGERISAGEALRRVRARFTGRSQNATYLAYQLYGDPNLQLIH